LGSKQQNKADRQHNKRFVQTGSSFLPYFNVGHPAAQTLGRYTQKEYSRRFKKSKQFFLIFSIHLLDYIKTILL